MTFENSLWRVTYRIYASDLLTASTIMQNTKKLSGNLTTNQELRDWMLKFENRQNLKALTKFDLSGDKMKKF